MRSQRVTAAEKAAFREQVKIARFSAAGIVRMDFGQRLPGLIALDARCLRIMAAILIEEAQALEIWKIVQEELRE